MLDLSLGTTQSSYTAQFILVTGNKCTICGGKRPKKVKIVTKIGDKGVYRGIRYMKNACVCTTILPLFQDNYPNCAPQVP